jgi:aprataxin
MRDLARWLTSQFATSNPELAPLRAGFHAVPSMRQLHLHLISSDLDSPCLKTKKHYNSFATDFFIPPEAWIRQLQKQNALGVNARAAEEGLKREMRCFFTGKSLKNVPELKAHLASRAFAAAIVQERQRQG